MGLVHTGLVTAALLALTGCTTSGPVSVSPSGGPASGATRPAVRADDPLYRVDWATATIDFGAGNGKACGTGVIDFSKVDRTQPAYKAVRNVALADLDGDGRLEAFVAVTCYAYLLVPRVSRWVLQREPSGTLRGVWHQEVSGSHWIIGDIVYIHAVGMSAVSAYRWNGSALVAAVGDNRYPELKTLDLSAFSDQLPCAAPQPLVFGADGKSIANGQEWTMTDGTGSSWIKLDREYESYLLLSLDCGPVGTPQNQRRTSLVIAEVADGGHRVLDVIPTCVGADVQATADGRRVTVTIHDYLADTFTEKQYLWIAKRLQRLD